ncbi:galectin-4-like [Mizuhopecten yessoensis]|uniref:Galectin n=1 Tax=Mizuhopecten yessoensis TaxID=6573 RepID=A0A210PM67_MIZYE|nr:galectin-4-like [Mizuhopecten yessoensis]OWF37600.1 32 kDa beta-galactoside-binding lectin [Mizuhopecten yessoensis]
MLIKLPVHDLGGDVLAIPNGLQPGKVVTVIGKCTGDKWFTINFQNQDGGNIALHFNPRPDNGVVVRNSFSDGAWANEERDQPSYPFTSNVDFTVTFVVTNECFKILVNGDKFCNFNHRLSHGEGSHLKLGGADFHEVHVLDRYTNGHNTPLHGGLKDGKAIRVLGACQDDSGFSLNFMSGSDFAFHFNPRPAEGTVVRNSMLGGGWGEEERECDGFPFETGAIFDAMFLCSGDEFTVFVNNKEYLTFAHRCDCSTVTDFQVHGKIDVKMVQCLTTMDDGYVKPLPFELGHKEQLVFRGFMKKGGNRFAVNFFEGSDTDSDIAFHLNPRVDQDEVVMNTRTGGGWGTEERIPLPSVFGTNDVFELKIISKKKKFKVVLDGETLCKYRCRGEMNEVKGIGISNGDSVLYMVDGRRRLGSREHVVLSDPLVEDSWVVVRGKIKKNGNGIAVNFLVGDAADGDIAFHFNPRISEGCTVRNACIGGGWQDEERDQPDFPFKQRQEFEITFQIKQDKFSTFVNGEPYIDFNHRVGLDQIGAVQLTGDGNFFAPEVL